MPRAAPAPSRFWTCSTSRRRAAALKSGGQKQEEERKKKNRRKRQRKGMYARSVDKKKHDEIMAQLLLRPSRCASSKKSNPDLQCSLGGFSFDFSTPAQTNPTKEGVNTSRMHSLSFWLSGAAPLSRDFFCFLVGRS